MSTKALGHNYFYRSSSCSVNSNCSEKINNSSKKFIG